MGGVFSPNTKIDNQKIAYGNFTTVTAVDSVPTGLTSVDTVVVSLRSDPGDDPEFVSAVPGSNGNFTLKSWKNTGGTDPTPAAATTFGKLVSWIAVGY